MTSPFTKPDATQDKYQDVYSKGGTFGSDLRTEDDVRRLLLTEVKNPFSKAIQDFAKGVDEVVGGIADAIRGITGGGARYKVINVAVNERLGPINTLITQTGERHKVLADKVEESVKKQEGINAEQGQAIKDADAAIQALKDYKAELQAKVQSSIDTAKSATSEAASLREELTKLANGLDARIEQSKAAKDLQAKFDQLNKDLGSKVDAAVSESTQIKELSERAKTTLDAVMNPIDIGTSLVSINPVTKVPYWAENATEVTDLEPPVKGAKIYSSPGITDTFGGLVTVDPRLEYEAEFYLHLNKEGVRTVIELRGQDGLLATNSSWSYDDSDLNTSPTNSYPWWSESNVPAGWHRVHVGFRLKPTVEQVKIAKIYWTHGGGKPGTASISNLKISPVIPSQAAIDEAQNKAIEAIGTATEANTTALAAQKKVNEESAKWKVETEDWKAKKDEFEKTSREFQKTQAKVEKLQTQTDDAQNKALELLNKPELNGSLIPMVPPKQEYEYYDKYQWVPEYFEKLSQLKHVELKAHGVWSTYARNTVVLDTTRMPCVPGGTYAVEFIGEANRDDTAIYLELRNAVGGSLAVEKSSDFKIPGSTARYGNNGAYAIPGIKLKKGVNTYKGYITLKSDVESVYLSRIYWNHSEGSDVGGQAIYNLKIYQPIPSQADIDKMQDDAIKLGQDFDKEQIKTNRLVQEQLWNHQDTMEFLDIRSPKTYGYTIKAGKGTSWNKTTVPYKRYWNGSTSSYYDATAYYNKEVSPFVTVLTEQGDKTAWVVCKGKWEGSFNISLNWTNGAVDNWSINLKSTGARVFQFDGGAATINLRQITITVFPDCLKREMNLQLSGSKKVGDSGTLSGDTSLLRYGSGYELRLRAPVRCNRDLDYLDENGVWKRMPAYKVFSGVRVRLRSQNSQHTFYEMWDYDSSWDAPSGNDWGSHNNNTSVDKFAAD